MGVGWSTAALVLVASGCSVVMNLDTNGYRAAEAGAGEAQASGCNADAGCFDLGCSASANCDGGKICCLAPSFASFDCEMGPACSTNVQLCTSDVECASASCIHQQCGSALRIHACGSIPFCTTMP
jgi:hypothetical protein